MILAICKLLGIFLILLFIITPLIKGLFKICFKEVRKQNEDIRQFLEKEMGRK